MSLRNRTVELLSLVFVLSPSYAFFAVKPVGSESGQRPSNAKTGLTQFQDPFEKAFVVDYPEGWTAKGGLFRLGYSDQRVMLDMRSPDGAMNVRLGDISIPTYAVPAQFHEQEGEVYDLGRRPKWS